MSRTAASSRTALIPSLQTDVRIWNVMSDSAAPTIETRNDTTFALPVIFLAVLYNTLKLNGLHIYCTYKLEYIIKLMSSSRETG